MHLYWKRGLTACMAAALLTGAMPALAWEAPSDNNWQAASREGVAAQVALDHQLAVYQLRLAVQQVDAGVADEVGGLQVDGVVVQLHGGGHLVQRALLE